MGLRSWWKKNMRDKSKDLPENWDSMNDDQKIEQILKEYVTLSMDNTYYEPGGGAEYGPWAELKTKYGKYPVFENALSEWIYEKARGKSPDYDGPSFQEVDDEKTLMNSVLGW